MLKENRLIVKVKKARLAEAELFFMKGSVGCSGKAIPGVQMGIAQNSETVGVPFHENQPGNF